MTPTDFPILFASAASEKRRELLAHLIETLDLAITNGSIRNVLYKDIKACLGRAAEHAWDKSVRDPYYAGQFKRSIEMDNLYFELNASSLHDFISTSKKIATTTLSGPAVNAMRALAMEVLPLSKAVRDLKSKIVMGREPRAEPVPVNPNKIVKTCSCCQRAIAVVGDDEGMAHHGYERPGNGEQTSSCPGIRFQPLETSLEGLLWMIERVKQNQAQIANSLNLFETLTEHIIPIQRKDGSRTFLRVEKDHPQWADVRDRLWRDLAFESRQAQSYADHLGKKLVEWQQYHATHHPDATSVNTHIVAISSEENQSSTHARPRG